MLRNLTAAHTPGNLWGNQYPPAILRAFTDPLTKAVRTPGFFSNPATQVVVKVTLYYAALIILASLALRYLPHSPGLGGVVMPSVFTGGSETVAVAKSGIAPPDETRAAMSSVAMLGAILLMLRWRGSITPLRSAVIRISRPAAVILLWSAPERRPRQDSLAPLQSPHCRGGAFPNTLDDSKDASTFFATGVGLAAAVDIKVATAISIISPDHPASWYADFGIHYELGARLPTAAGEAKDLHDRDFCCQLDNEFSKPVCRAARGERSGPGTCARRRKA